MSRPPNEEELPPITNIRRYRYRPGDRIIVRINQRLDDFTIDRVGEFVTDKLGVPREFVIVLDSGNDIKVLRKVEGCESTSDPASA